MRDRVVTEQALAESDPRPVWHSPRVERIDVKRTLLSGGSFTDGVVSTAVPTG